MSQTNKNCEDMANEAARVVEEKTTAGWGLKNMLFCLFAFVSSHKLLSNSIYITDLTIDVYRKPMLCYNFF